MNYVSTFKPKTSFNSVNGGIKMWLCRLADDLAADRKLEIFLVLENEIARTEHSDQKADLYLISCALKNLDNFALEGAIAAADKPFQRKYDFQVRRHQCNKKLEVSKRQWLAAAELANIQIAAWGKWARATKNAHSNEQLTPHAYFSGMREPLSVTCVSSILDSPKSFEVNRKYFKSVIDAIRTVIFEGYRTANHPLALDRLSFDTAVDAFETLLKLHKTLLIEKEGICEELSRAAERYESAKQPLVDLLALIPNTAQEALFRLQRPDLCERAPAICNETELELTPFH